MTSNPAARVARRTSATGEPALIHKRRFGFTLVELLIVLVILAITLSLATLSFSAFDRSRFETTVDRTVALLRTAATEAELTGRLRAVRFSPGAAPELGERDASGSWQWQAAAADYVAAVPVSVRVSRAGKPSEDAIVALSPELPQTEQEVVVATADETAFIRLDRHGRVLVSR